MAVVAMAVTPSVVAVSVVAVSVITAVVWVVIGAIVVRVVPVAGIPVSIVIGRIRVTIVGRPPGEAKRRATVSETEVKPESTMSRSRCG
jgi:hypothetical protein